MKLYKFELDGDFIVKAETEDDAVYIAEGVINQHLVCEECAENETNTDEVIYSSEDC